MKKFENRLLLYVHNAEIMFFVAVLTYCMLSCGLKKKSFPAIKAQLKVLILKELKCKQYQW